MLLAAGQCLTKGFYCLEGQKLIFRTQRADGTKEHGHHFRRPDLATDLHS